MMTGNQVYDIRMSEVLSALSYALDITEGQPEGHAVRSCYIGMRLANYLTLDNEQRSALFYSLLLKDLGCSSNAAKVTYLFGSDDRRTKFRLKTVNWSNLVEAGAYAIRNASVGLPIWKRLKRIISLGLAGERAAKGLIQIRCERGSEIARSLGFPEETALAIPHLDEHWDGRGHPLGLRGEEISLMGRVLGFAQTVDVFSVELGKGAAQRMVRQRRGKWFDPKLCDIFFDHLADDRGFWEQLGSSDLIGLIGEFEPQEEILRADEDRLDEIAVAFARVIDAKSPYTATHSKRVAEIVLGMAGALKVTVEEQRKLSRAALLHDIGKLGVSNMILDKAGKLTDEEMSLMQKHPQFTYDILRRVNGFSQLAGMAAAHHERLDGHGYHIGMEERELSMNARLLAVADQFEALTADRPYREALSEQAALDTLEQQVGTGIDPEAFDALQLYLEGRASAALDTQ